jgi:hypothetical protein
MNSPEEKDSLDALLREQNIYIEDRGFTARVVQSLPRHQTRWLRQSFLLGVSIIGWILAAWWLPLANLPVLDFSTLASLNSQVLLPWITVCLVLACLAWSTVAAVQWED